MKNNIIFALVVVVAFIALCSVYFTSNQAPIQKGVISPPVSTYSTTTLYTITNSSTYVEATTSRSYYLFSNLGPQSIYLSCNQGNAALINQGILITASSTYEMSIQKGNACYGAIRAIAAGAASDILSVTGY